MLWAVAICYAVFILYRLTRLARLWQRKEMLRRSVYARELSPEMKRIAALCRAAFRLGEVPLGCSTRALLPVTVGARNPLIVLPERLYSEPGEETLLSVIGHEMAHVARRDFSLNLVCEVLAFHLVSPSHIDQKKKTARKGCESGDRALLAKKLMPITRTRAGE